ncbi:MAG: iron-containing alcohol dehydrogenase [Acidobacteria bacterium]|nr:iron-containing alcohol dehydrogenase [Acidobacteriota bacterium]
MITLDYHPRTRVLFGPGAHETLGTQARELGFRRTLLVSDPGIREAGYVDTAIRLLMDAGVAVAAFHDFHENPDTVMTEVGRQFAASQDIDSIIALGGGSSMDCGKAINFLLTNGGTMRDYWGYGKASKPMLPMIAVPTTAGTGSEGQSYALISDAETHVKMACGDPKVAFKLALLDPVLCATAPQSVIATAGYDAISHAVETWVTTKRNAISLAFSREAWKLLNRSFEKVLADPYDHDAMGGMLLGAHMAGTAIENSMLGATHACANPLTASYGTTHGVAIALLLHHVVRFNTSAVDGAYESLAPDLAPRLQELATAAGLPLRLKSIDVPEEDLARLSEAAALQWTGKFNPRPFDAAAAREIYECAW